MAEAKGSAKKSAEQEEQDEAAVAQASRSTKTAKDTEKAEANRKATDRGGRPADPKADPESFVNKDHHHAQAARSTGNQRRTSEQNTFGEEFFGGEPTPDSAAQVGFFCRVIKGEHVGRYGVLLQHNVDDGECLVETRDADNMRLIVKYDELRMDQAGRR